MLHAMKEGDPAPVATEFIDIRKFGVMWLECRIIDFYGAEEVRHLRLIMKQSSSPSQLRVGEQAHGDYWASNSNVTGSNAGQGLCL